MQRSFSKFLGKFRPASLRHQGWKLAVGSAIAAGTVLRLTGIPPSIADVDGVNFALALKRFDPLHQAPHFPGYPIYVFLSRPFALLGLSESWALSLPGILLWPVAAWILFLGMRRRLGFYAAFGATTTASLAPGAVLVGAWPGSDGLGLALLCLAAGLTGLGLDPNPRSPGVCVARQRALACSGLLLGLLLGVRLTWWPLILGIMLWWAASMLRNSQRDALPWIGLISGTLLWFLPLLSTFGFKAWWQLGKNFVIGHMQTWGKTVWASDEALTFSERCQHLLHNLGSVGLGVSMSDARTAPFQQLAVASIIALVAMGILGLPKALGANRRTKCLSPLGWLCLLLTPYGVWLFFFQNITQARHAVPFLLLLGAAIALGLRHFPSARPLRRALLFLWPLASLSVSLPRAWIQGQELSPTPALLQDLRLHHSPEGLQIFAGDEARVLAYLAPAYRVYKATDAKTLAREAERLSLLGVEVLVSSESPGVDALRPKLETHQRFEFPATIRPHDALLEVYRYCPQQDRPGCSAAPAGSQHCDPSPRANDACATPKES